MDKSSKPSNANRNKNNSGLSFLNELGPLLILTSIFFLNFASRITLAPNLSFVAAPLISEAVMVWFSWRAVILLFGCATLIMSPVFYYYSCGGEFRGETPIFVSFRKVFGNLSFWIMMLLFSLAIISTLGIYTMLPLYLIAEHSIDRNLANILIALSRISGVIMTFIGGWATDRFGPRQWQLKICTSGLTLTSKALAVL